MTPLLAQKHLSLTALVLAGLLVFNHPLAAQDAAAPSLLDLAEPSEQAIGNFGAKLAYNSNLGAVAGISYTANQVFGRPHQVVLSAEASKSDQRLSFGYIIPSLSDDSPEWGLSIYRNDTSATETYDFDTLSYGLRPSWSKPLSDHARITVFADFSQDEISNLAVGSSALIAADVGQRNKGALGLKYQWKNANTDLRLSGSLAKTSTGGQFLKTEVALRRNWTAPDAAVQFSSDLNLGQLTSSQGMTNIGDRFFLGSGQMRGFGLAGQGPRDLAAGSAALGGNSFAALKLDMTFPRALPKQDIFVPGLFVDMGSLWGLDDTAGGTAGADPVDDGRYLRSSVGLSGRFNLGKAALNIYASRLLQSQSYDQENQLQMSLSAKF